MTVDSDVVVTESVREIEIDGPPDEVWESIADPEALSEWLGGELDLDGPLEPGAAGTFVEPDGREHEVLIVGVDPAERIAWHWWTDDDELSSVEITLTPGEDDHTIVRVSEVLMLEAVAPTFGEHGSSATRLEMRAGTLVGV